MVILASSRNTGLILFQYSLCRVVLMVEFSQLQAGHFLVFQYSLCRVVLMVQLQV